MTMYDETIIRIINQAAINATKSLAVIRMNSRPENYRPIKVEFWSILWDKDYGEKDFIRYKVTYASDNRSNITIALNNIPLTFMETALNYLRPKIPLHSGPCVAIHARSTIDGYKFNESMDSELNAQSQNKGKRVSLKLKWHTKNILNSGPDFIDTANGQFIKAPNLEKLSNDEILKTINLNESDVKGKISKLICEKLKLTSINKDLVVFDRIEMSEYGYRFVYKFNDSNEFIILYRWHMCQDLNKYNASYWYPELV